MTKTLTAVTFAIAVSVASIGATASADAFPNIFSTKGLAGLDLGSGR